MDDDFFLPPSSSFQDSLENDSEEINEGICRSANKEVKAEAETLGSNERISSPEVPRQAVTEQDGGDKENSSRCTKSRHDGDIPSSRTDSVVNKKERKRKKKRQTKTSEVNESTNTLKEGEETKRICLDYKDKILKTLKFFVRKGRVFEIRKLNKRIQILRRKKGTEKETAKNDRKITRLLAEIEVMKNMNVDQSCEKVSVCLNEVFDATLIATQESSENVDWLKKLSDRVSLEDDGSVNCLKCLSLKSIVAKFEQELTELLKICSNDAKKVSEDDDDMLIQVDPTHEKDATGEDKLEKESINSKKKMVEIKTDKELGKNGKNKISKKRMREIKKTNGKRNMDSMKKVLSSVEQNIEDKTLEQKDVISNKSNISKRKNIDDKNDDEYRDKVKMKRFKAQLQKLKNRHGNRLGQRARRELWEKMYGKDAVHMKKGVKLERKDKLKSNQSDLKKHFGNKGKSHDNMKQIQERKMKNAETNLHPSWQAKKHQKEQNQIVQFQGSKITFDD